MALIIPQNPPLTDSQAQVTAKIGSMKSLLSLPVNPQNSIPKNQQISLFDYLTKVLQTMGFPIEPILNNFIQIVLNQSGTFLEDSTISAIGGAIGSQGMQLFPFIDNRSIVNTLSQTVITDYQTSNKMYLISLIPNTFLQNLKQDIAKKLLLMIFGPQDGPSAQLLVSDPAERARLISNAICGSNIFSLSNSFVNTNDDVEFQTQKLKQQLQTGQVQMQISCQDVKISLPQNPSFIFTGGGIFTVPGNTPPTPSQSLNFVVQYVNNNVQRINNETNAQHAGQSFLEILVTKLISYMGIIIEPYLSNIFVLINNDLASRNILATIVQGQVIYSACSISQDPNSNPKKQYEANLLNSLLKQLLKMLLLFAIKNFEQIVVNYFERTALEKQKRKLEKIRERYSIFNQVAVVAEQSALAAQALNALQGVLSAA